MFTAVASGDKANPFALQSTLMPSRVVTPVTSTWNGQPAEGCLLLLIFMLKALDAVIVGGSIKVLRKTEHSGRRGEELWGLKKRILKKQTF